MTDDHFKQLTEHGALKEYHYLVWRLFGVKICMLSPDMSRVVYFGSRQGNLPFCAKLQQQPEARRRCLGCDRRHVNEVLELRRSLHYTCYVGLSEFIVPVIADGVIVALIQCGQVLEQPPSELYWREFCLTLRRNGLDPKPLRDGFFQTPALAYSRQQDLLRQIELIVTHLVQSQGRSNPLQPAPSPVDAACSYIRHNFQCDISLDAVAASTQVSRRTLTRRFRQVMGQSVHAYLMHCRIQHACDLLAAATYDCAAIARECGFGSVQQFNRIFKQLRQTTPSQWRRDHYTTISSTGCPSQSVECDPGIRQK